MTGTESGLFAQEGNMIGGQFKSVGLRHEVMSIWKQSALLKRIPQSQRVLLLQEVSKSSEQYKKALVHMPVPPLQQTLDKYLRTIKPFTNETEFKATQKLCEEFSQKEGEVLQQLLEKRSKETVNWLAQWWLDFAYLGYRDPVVVHSSPALISQHTTKFQHLSDQLVYTTHMIAAALEFNELMEKKLVPQEMSGKDPLCMLQYERLFGTHRIPDKPKDKLKLPDLKNPSRNIIVMYNNYVFDLDVFQEGRTPATPEQIFGMLNEVVKEGSGKPGPAVGVLSSGNRDDWADAHALLKKDEVNRRHLEEHIEKSLFVVCIDKKLGVGKELNHNTVCGKSLLHGFGGSTNGSNRWFDKTVQFVVGAGSDGVGITYEHSPAEAGPIGVVTDYVHNFTIKAPKKIEASTNYTKPKKLVFNITPELSEAIKKAQERLDKVNDDLEVIGYSFPYFGKNRLKTAKMSPDSFIQLAIQYAFFKTHNRPAAHYESGTLRKFSEGRTDVIRTCLEEVVNFCKVMSDAKSTKEQKSEALKAAMDAHKNYALDVINGRGIDRHLLGLRLIAKANKMNEPAIFSDPPFIRSSHYQLSTSNVPTQCDGFMVYGPLVDDGYACCYNPRNENINFGTSAWRTSDYTRLNSFVVNLEQALIEMETVLPGPAVTSKL